MTDSLRDRLHRPIHDLRVSVTDRCNLRCTYCMPAELYHDDFQFQPREALLTFEEIARFVQVVAPIGVEKIRITGGEPLLRRDLHELVQMLAEIPGIQDIALTTNGILLSRFAQSLKDAGLHRITVSLDSLDPEVLKHISGRDTAPGQVLEGIAAAQAAGFETIKVNTVVQRGVNDDGVVDLVRHFHGTGVTLRFIEFMDVGTMNGWRREHVVPAAELLDRIQAHFPLTPAEARYPGEVANRFRFSDGGGEIGVIASVTQPFCGACSRLRLTCDGQLFTCLFASQGHNLKQELRNDTNDLHLRQYLESIWKNRTDRYSEIRTAATAQQDKVEMYHIGG